MSDDPRDTESGFRRLIRESKEEAFHARRQLRRDLPNPSLETKRRVAEALSDYRDQLSDYQGERVLRTPWSERDVDIDVLDRYLAETTTTERRLNRRHGASETVTVPKVAEVSAHELLAIGKELDAIAKELGFAASPKDETPSEEATLSDLRGLLKGREQTEALKYLPEADDSEA